MDWYTCTVVSAGPAEDGIVYIKLNDVGSKFGDTWFRAAPVIKDNALRVALAAITDDKKVSATMADIAPYSQINRIYLLK